MAHKARPGDGKGWEATGEIVTDEEARSRTIEGGAKSTLEWEAPTRPIRVLPCARTIALTPPQKVADGVVRGIECNIGEVVVASIELLAATVLGMLAPALSWGVQRRAGAVDIAASHIGAETG